MHDVKQPVTVTQKKDGELVLISRGETELSGTMDANYENGANDIGIL